MTALVLTLLWEAHERGMRNLHISHDNQTRRLTVYMQDHGQVWSPDGTRAASVD